MPNFSQSDRFLKLNTPLGEDGLILASFDGYDAFSELFQFDLEMVSEEAEIDPADLVGQEISWSVEDPETGQRHFAGIVRRFSAGGTDSAGLRIYRAIVVP